MNTETLTLTGFLLARFAEEEQTLADWDIELRTRSAGPVSPPAYNIRERALAKCEADRRIVTLMGYVRESWDNKHSGEGRVMWPDVNRREKMHAMTILESLALSYADHPDFRDEWRP